MVKQKWGCIYRLTNTTNGMKYIGKTVNYRDRMVHHKNSNSRAYISRSIRKYGWGTFKKEIIIDDVPEEDLNSLEISYINVENTMRPNGYNLTRGGEGISGLKHSMTTKKILRKLNLQRLSKRKQFGSVSYHKKLKKWHIKSASPERKTIGYYNTETKAREALKLYNETGKRMESDRKIRKQGHIKRTPNGRYEAQITKNKKTKIKTFDSVKECEEFFKNCRNNN